MSETIHILLIDHDSQRRRETLKALQEHGYAVTAAETGAQGLRLAQAQKPDLILLEMALPDMDGVQVCQRIKWEPGLDNSVVVLLSADQTLSDDLVRGMEAGADGYIIRPISNQELLTRIAVMLRLKQAETRVHFQVRLLDAVEQAVIVTDPSGRVVYWNPFAERLYGWSAKEALGKTTIELIASEEAQQHSAEMMAHLRAGQSWSGEYVARHRDGARLLIQSSITPVHDAHGTLTHIIGLSRDISARVQAESTREAALEALQQAHDALEKRVAERTAALAQANQTLRESEEKYRALYDNAPLSYQSLDKDGYFLDVNPTWLRTLGYEREKVIGKQFAAFLHPDWKPHFEKNFPEFKRRGYIDNVRFKIRHRDGHYLHISFKGCIGYEPDGRFRQTFCVFQDITEQVQAESQKQAALEALQKSEERFRMTVHRSPIGVGIVDSAGNLTDCNAALANMVGYSRKELLRLNFADFTHPDDLTREQRLIKEMWQEKTSEYRMEKRYIHKDGHTVWVDVVASLFKGESGALEFGFAFVQDITERRRAELQREAALQALQESEARFRQVYEHMAIGVARVALDFRIENANEAYCRMLGYREAELIGKHLKEITHPEVVKDHLRKQSQLAAGEIDHYRIEKQFIHKSGRAVHGILDANLIRDATGTPAYFLGSVVDITERKQAEHALHHYAERLQIEHEIDTAILAAQSPEEIAHAALARLHALIPCRHASIAEIDPSQQQSRDLIVLFNGTLQTNTARWYPFSNAGQPMIATLQRGQPHLVYDTAALEAPAPLERTLMANGMRSFVSVPMLVQGTLVGTLNLGSHVPDFFQPTHVEILQEVAVSLSIALQQARLLEQTRQAAETNAMLLHEVNHRVLNNLTMILSILDVERRRPLDEQVDFQTALDDVASRIHGMVTVHRMLAGAQGAALDLGEVVTKVIRAALSGSPIQHHITVTVDAPDAPLYVTSRQAIAVALVINELTTNSAKYAFRERSQGRIHVQITTVKDAGRNQVHVVFRDDGPGMPDDVLAGRRQNVGLWLVQINATRTLGGEVEWWNDDGAVVSFTFARAPSN